MLQADLNNKKWQKPSVKLLEIAKLVKVAKNTPE